MLFQVKDVKIFEPGVFFGIDRAIKEEILRFSATGQKAAKGGLISGALTDVPVKGFDSPMNLYIICKYDIVDQKIQMPFLWIFLFDQMADEILDFHLSLKKSQSIELI